MLHAVQQARSERSRTSPIVVPSTAIMIRRGASIALNQSTSVCLFGAGIPWDGLRQLLACSTDAFMLENSLLHLVMHKETWRTRLTANCERANLRWGHQPTGQDIIAAHVFVANKVVFR